MPEPDYQGFANTVNTLSSPVTLANNVASLNSINQAGATSRAGKLIAAGDYAGGAAQLYNSGQLPQGAAVQQFGAGVAGATAAAMRDYPGAAQAAASVGDMGGVTSAQGSQFQQYQQVGAYLQQAAPIFRAAYQQNGTAGLVHATGLVTQELTAGGLMSPAQAQEINTSAATDPQGTLANIDGFVQQLQYQKLGKNSVLGTNAIGTPGAIVTAPQQTSLPTPGGGATLVQTPASVTQVGPNGVAQAPSAPLSTADPTGQASSPAAPTSLPPPQSPLASAILQQESGANAQSPNSVNGAVGPMQILPATFAQYAKPGENISNPVDNMNVGNRIIASYQQQYPGDPARAAVAYFSGPGNVSPPGSPVPWKQDVKDGNGTPVSSYVLNTMSHMPPPPTSGQAFQGNGQPVAPTTAPGSATTLASTAANGSLFRPATASELPPGAVSAQINTATGQISNIINQGDVNNLTPAAQKQLGEQYWLTGQMPRNMPRGGAAAAAMQSVQNYAAQKSAQMGYSGADDNLRHVTVNAAQNTINEMLPQQAQLATAENNAIDNGNQIRQLLPQAAATYGIRTLNDLQQFLKRETNSPQLAALDTAFNDFTGDYSKVMFSNASGSGGAGGVTDREANKELFDPDDTVPVALAKLNQAQKGMSFRTAEFGATLQRMNQIARTGIIPPSTAAQPVSGNQAPTPVSGASAPMQPPRSPQQAQAPAQKASFASAVQMLQQNPSLASQFDKRYGPGASAAYLRSSAPSPAVAAQQSALRWLQPSAMQ
jgi:hypothetical protein